MRKTSNIANGLENLKTQFCVAYFTSHDCLSCYAQPTLQHAPENATTNTVANTKPGIASKTVGWQENSSRRGTMDILQSSLFTILICTWTVQHLNIPTPSDSKRRRLFRKIWWMLITVLVPEFLLVHVIMERKMAFESAAYERL